MKDISHHAYPVFCPLGNTKNPPVEFEMLDDPNNTVRDLLNRMDEIKKGDTRVKWFIVFPVTRIKVYNSEEESPSFDDTINRLLPADISHLKKKKSNDGIAISTKREANVRQNRKVRQIKRETDKKVRIKDELIEPEVEEEIGVLDLIKDKEDNDDTEGELAPAPAPAPPRRSARTRKAEG